MMECGKNKIMATIKKIKNSKKGSYQIVVSNGYDSNNKQIRVTTTFTPDTTKSQRQQEKQVHEFAIEFERYIHDGGSVKSFNNMIKKRKEHSHRQMRYFNNLKNIKCPVMLSAEEIGKELNFSRSQIVNIVKHNNLPVLYIGNKMMINKISFYNFLNGGKYENCEWNKFVYHVGFCCNLCKSEN